MASLPSMNAYKFSLVLESKQGLDQQNIPPSYCDFTLTYVFGVRVVSTHMKLWSYLFRKYLGMIFRQNQQIFISLTRHFSQVVLPEAKFSKRNYV